MDCWWNGHDDFENYFVNDNHNYDIDNFDNDNGIIIIIGYDDNNNNNNSKNIDIDVSLSIKGRTIICVQRVRLWVLHCMEEVYVCFIIL